jgi:myosin heavy subunit
METIKLRKAGFPCRMPHQKFIDSYGILLREYNTYGIENYLKSVC